MCICKRCTDIGLYLSSRPSGSGLSFVAVTSVLPNKAHSAAKNFDAYCGSWSITMVLRTPQRTSQCSRELIASCEAVTLRAGIHTVSLPYPSAIMITKQFSCLVFFKWSSMSISVNSGGLLGGNHCIHFDVFEQICGCGRICILIRSCRHLKPCEASRNSTVNCRTFAVYEDIWQ